VQAGRCAAHLSVERRIAIDEINGEAEFRGEEVDGCLEVANVQMCGHRGENRPGVGMRLGHGTQSSCSQRLPSCKALFARNKFLRVSQAKSRRQNFLIGEVTEPGQVFPDHGGDGIIPLAMPSQILPGLFSEVFEVRHRRNERLCCVGGPCPSDLHRCALRRRSRFFPRELNCQRNLRLYDPSRADQSARC